MPPHSEVHDESETAAPHTIRVLGRYALHREIAAGGMATVHLGRLLGPVGFARTVAIKRLHPQFAREPEFVSMFLDEARLAARIRHPNVVSTLDVVAADGEIFLVMEYVEGEALSTLSRVASTRNERIPPRIAASIVVGCLHGLHAAHEARDEQGAPLEIVHRDVSPQNMLVGVDGIPHLLDFGIARAAGRLVTTREGHIKGKFAYMAPEQLHGEPATRKSDIFGAAIVLWETLAGERLFVGETEGAVLERVLFSDIPPVRSRNPGLPESIDAVIARGLARAPAARYETAREMALALESALGVASPTELATWLERTARESLDSRAAVVAEVESAVTPPSQSARALPSAPTTMPRPILPQRAVAPAPANEPRTKPMEKRALTTGAAASGREPGARVSDDASPRRPAVGTVRVVAAVALATVLLGALAVGLGLAHPPRAEAIGAASASASPSAAVPSSTVAPAAAPAAAPATASASAAARATASASASAAASASASAHGVVPPSRAAHSAPRPARTAAPAQGLKGLPSDRE